MSKRKPSTKAKQAKLISMHMAYPLARMKPFGKNPRNHEDTIDLLVRSLGIFGAIAPIVLRQDGTIAAGHARFKAAKQQGRKTFPAIKVKFVDEEAFIAYVMADNQIATRSTWISADFGVLQDQLADAGWVPKDTGFDPDMIPAIRAADLGMDDKQRARADEIPKPPKKAKSRLGDLYILGKHRLLCGDAKKEVDVNRLMDGAKADCVLTDPPYGIGQKGVPGDEPEKLSKLINAAIPLFPVKNAVVIAFQSTRTFPVWLDCIRENDHKFERILSLYKEAQCTYPWRGWILISESILVSTVGKPSWQDVKPYHHDVYIVSEVSHEIPDDIGWHGSIKPIVVVVDLLSRIGKQRGLVFDPFLGSGTTMIACEQLGRRCFGMEIEPIYIDVIVKRWENFTGKKAKRMRRG